MGNTFTVADAYCGGMLNWTKPAQYEVGEHPNVAAYYERYCARDSAKQAIAAEG